MDTVEFDETVHNMRNFPQIFESDCRSQARRRLSLDAIPNVPLWTFGVQKIRACSASDFSGNICYGILWCWSGGPYGWGWLGSYGCAGEQGCTLSNHRDIILIRASSILLTIRGWHGWDSDWRQSGLGLSRIKPVLVCQQVVYCTTALNHAVKDVGIFGMDVPLYALYTINEKK